MSFYENKAEHAVQSYTARKKYLIHNANFCQANANFCQAHANVFNLVYINDNQDVLGEQALNSKINTAQFLLSTYEVSNKRAGTN